jgi:hypothetical protein
MKKSFYFDPYASGTAVFLGPIEAQLMDLAWQKKNLTVKTALFSLGSEKKLAYTTVMTVLARLAKKGLLQKRRTGLCLFAVCREINLHQRAAPACL